MEVPVRTTVIGIVLVVLITTGIPAGEERPDPWIGKTRADVVDRLGEPTKIKSGKGGSRTLVFRFHRPRADTAPGPRAITVEVPGVGTLVRILPRDLEEVVLEPTMIGKDRALEPGGHRVRHGGSTTYDPKTGEVRRDGSAGDDLAVGRKVRLTFEIGADDRVESWSVSPKRVLR
jgi:hypothetical protein